MRSIELAPGRRLQAFDHYPGGPFAGWVMWHPRRDTGAKCGATFLAQHLGPADTRPMWMVVSNEPLTLAPSLVCTRCGDHGFVRDDHWIAA